MEIPTLQTDRLLLTPFGIYPNDVADIQRNINHPDIAKFMAIPWPYPADGAAYWMGKCQKEVAAGQKIAWGLRLKSNPDECIGCIDYHLKKDGAPNTWGRGFWLAVAHQRQGLMSEAVLETMHWMFDNTDMQMLKTENLIDNPASCRIKEKMGFKHVGYKTLENCPYRNNEPMNLDCWELTRERWQAFVDGSLDVGQTSPEL